MRALFQNMPAINLQVYTPDTGQSENVRIENQERTSRNWSSDHCTTVSK